MPSPLLHSGSSDFVMVSAPGNFGQLKMTLVVFARSETMQCESVTVGARVVVPADRERVETGELLEVIRIADI